jgi:hypothetical protein
MNQCDGCLANRPLVILRGGEYWVDPRGTSHVMGKYTAESNGRIIPTGYADLMACCKDHYEEKTSQ